MASAAHGSGAPGESATTEIPSVDTPSSAGTSPAGAHAAAGDDTFAERPEIFVGAAFAGGLVLAQLLKRVHR
jgi:hypothetical protein